MLWQKQTSKVRRKRLTGRYASESMVRETFLRRWHWNEWGSDLRKDPGKAIPGEENIKRKGLKRPVGEIVSVCTRVEWVGHQRGLGTKAAGTDYIEPSKPSSGLGCYPEWEEVTEAWSSRQWSSLSYFFKDAPWLLCGEVCGGKTGNRRPVGSHSLKAESLGLANRFTWFKERGETWVCFE